MTIQRYVLPVLAAATVLASCSAPRKLRESEARNARLDSLYKDATAKLQRCDEDAARAAAAYKDRVASLTEKQQQLQTNNTQMLDHLKELSVISSSQAESIKKSLDNIGAKDAYIKDLQGAIARKDSLNMQLVLNLKGAIGNLDDKDINIKVEKGVVYIDISDKLLFKSGSYEVTDKAKDVLGKVAKVLLNQPDIEFMVEGHTDNVPYRPNVLLDNWDLSVKRATSVVRILQNQYGIPPARMTAAGRSEYVPVASNDTPEGKSANRRTRIVILPQLDQFFKLLEKPAN
ncbi:chemotaxis protein MotB [Chitinophaga jiangningensis]|uniref:Chemotaxis protein MotB n=1 Tax=Chitinophaga jiangningensis TaxID=1419482 RepID=A0A1M7L455_9BACT|nr:OmpA family protein [Chitinophaga jiangningensis]SHM72333.1 chemotaxis protein MotB [Chitinophaga jiangningensis]